MSRPPTPVAPAMVNLGYLLADLWDPPDLDGAQHWYVRNLVIDLRDSRTRRARDRMRTRQSADDD
jgi:hypothetical protein